MYGLLSKAHEGIHSLFFFHLFFLFSLFFFFFFFGNWLHKKASCEPSSLNEKHVAGIQNSGVFQHGPCRHLFLVCTAKSWSRGEGLWWKRRVGGVHDCLRGSKRRNWGEGAETVATSALFFVFSPLSCWSVEPTCGSYSLLSAGAIKHVNGDGFSGQV